MRDVRWLWVVDQSFPSHGFFSILLACSFHFLPNLQTAGGILLPETGKKANEGEVRMCLWWSEEGRSGGKTEHVSPRSS